MQGGAGWAGSRMLLKQLRDVMTGGGSAQDRLDHIVRLIASGMVAEVCSCYVARPGEILELFATQGLNPQAVHRTRMRVGEGLVGEIASSRNVLVLAEAQKHPNFAYRPETGEEIYHSFLGVPILRGNAVQGVLVVQNRTPRHYQDEETEAMETIAMVVSGLISSGELVSPSELRAAGMPLRLEGVRFNPGLAIGEVVLHQPRVLIRQVVAEDPEVELRRLQGAASAMRESLDDLVRQWSGEPGGEHMAILESVRMFAEDRGWLSRIAAAIQSGLTAEAAVERVARDTRVRMQAARDPYLREALLDLDELANRLLWQLTGQARPGEQDLPQDAVIVARAMGAAELLDYERDRLRALVLEEGTANSHVAIVARALDIPVIGRLGAVLDQVDQGDPIIVDADHAQVFVRPSEQIQGSITDVLQSRASRRAADAVDRDLPAVSRDGTPVSLSINVGLLADMESLAQTGADGVGLYRTEIPFMVRSSFPDVANQAQIYGRVLDKAGDRPVVFRMLDAGGDKRLPYWSQSDDENPAMGWRAMRIVLDRPQMLRQQTRALLRAANGRPIRVMFPMISDVSEFEAARRIVELELDRHMAAGAPAPELLALGTMIEVPALVFQMDALLRRVDFVAVGSNDLSQFFFASDRANPRLANRYDVLSPAMLSLLRRIVEDSSARGVPVSLCGEMAGTPLEAMALLGVGFRALSMTPSAIADVKAMVRSVDISEVSDYMATLFDRPDRSLRRRLTSFARDHGVAIGAG